MYTVAETPIFTADADRLWPEDARLEFVAWIAANPLAGDVIPKSGGCRKVRWSRAGTGKRGGVRVIYFNQFANGKIWLLVIYAKATRGDIPGHLLKQIQETIER